MVKVNILDMSNKLLTQAEVAVLPNKDDLVSILDRGDYYRVARVVHHPRRTVEESYVNIFLKKL